MPERSLKPIEMIINQRGVEEAEHVLGEMQTQIDEVRQYLDELKQEFAELIREWHDPTEYVGMNSERKKYLVEATKSARDFLKRFEDLQQQMRAAIVHLEDVIEERVLFDKRKEVH